MNNKYISLLIFALLVLSFVSISIVSASTIKEINYSTSTVKPLENANFIVKVLKYEPYPVNAGDWFDLWVKVQNVGQEDALNSQFELQPSYPFTSNDSLIRNYGLIYGTINSNKINNNGDSSQVVLKYRVKVDENAASKVENLKLLVRSNVDNLNQIASSFDLPVEIAQTKTDFDLNVRSISNQESSFIISNTGKNTAKAITINVKEQTSINFLKDFEPQILGDLTMGSFTIAHLKIVPNSNAKNLTLEISYTDTAGVRSTIEKVVSLESSNIQNICSQTDSKTYLYWIYALIGLITGAFIVVLSYLIVKKRRSK